MHRNPDAAQFAVAIAAMWNKLAPSVSFLKE
jgi:hypothetical protein